MAKRNKIKRRARYHKGTRHDYRGGGRVKAYGGGFAPGNIEIDEKAITSIIFYTDFNPS